LNNFVSDDQTCGRVNATLPVSVKLSSKLYEVCKSHLPCSFIRSESAYPIPLLCSGLTKKQDENLADGFTGLNIAGQDT